MNIDDICSKLNPEIVIRFKRAIETGYWPDGKKLSAEQTETCMQAVIAYEYKNVPKEQHTGYVPPKEDPCGDKNVDDKKDQPLKWQ